MKIKAIAFDLDGTLYPSYKMYYHTAVTFFRHPVITIKFGKVRKELRTKTNIMDFYAYQAELLGERMNMDPKQIRTILENDFYGVWETSFRGLNPYHDIKRVLEIVKEQGFKLGLLSDFPVQNKLRYMNLGNCGWDVKLCSEEVGYLKPDSRAFLEMAAHLGLQPDEILFVGNNYQYDILGAKNAGMKTAYINKSFLNLKKRKNSEADINFKTYGEFLIRLKKILIDN